MVLFLHFRIQKYSANTEIFQMRSKNRNYCRYWDWGTSLHERWPIYTAFHQNSVSARDLTGIQNLTSNVIVTLNRISTRQAIANNGQFFGVPIASDLEKYKFWHHSLVCVVYPLRWVWSGLDGKSLTQRNCCLPFRFPGFCFRQTKVPSSGEQFKCSCGLGIDELPIPVPFMRRYKGIGNGD